MSGIPVLQPGRGHPRRTDLAAVKARQQGAWSSGDYAVVGTTLQIVGEELCEALDLRPGQKVLDVAAGNGNVTLAAARRWCDVVSTDYVPSLLERGRCAPWPKVCRSNSGKPMRKRCRLPTAASTRSSRPLASCSRRTRIRRRPRCSGSASAAARSGSPIGRRTASSVSCSRRSAISAAAGRREIAGVVGHPRAPRRNVRNGGRIDQGRARAFRVPLPLAGALAGRVQDLLRPDAEGVRGARRSKRQGSAMICLR